MLVTGFPHAHKAGLGAPTNPEAQEEDAWRRLVPVFGRRVASASRWAVLKALAGAACAAVAPYAAKELQRRAAGRIGYGAAELEVLRRAEHLAPVFGVSGRAIERLTRAAQHRLRGVLRKRGLDEALIQEFLRDVPTPCPWPPEAFQGLGGDLERIAGHLRGLVSALREFDAAVNEAELGQEAAERQRWLHEALLDAVEHEQDRLQALAPLAAYCAGTSTAAEASR